MAIVLTIARIGIGGVFIYSGWNKLLSPIQEFEYALEQYHLFSGIWTAVVANVIPWLEFILGAFVMLGFMRKQSAQMLSGLCLGFILVLASTVIRGIDVANCGCFGDAIHLSPQQAMMVDIGFLLLLALIARAPRTLLEMDQLLISSNR